MRGRVRRSQSKLSVWTRRMSEHWIQVRDAALVSKESNHRRNSTSTSGPYVHTYAPATCLHTCEFVSILHIHVQKETELQTLFVKSMVTEMCHLIREFSDNDYFRMKSYHPRQVISLSDTHFLIWRIRRLASYCGAVTPTTIFKFLPMK